MAAKPKKQAPRTGAHKKVNGECVIPAAIPVEELGQLLVNELPSEADEIRSYMKSQAPDENVRHLEKVASESVFGQPMDGWDVRTNKGRWWVITNPTNLYSQRLFPSLDYTMSFHVGVTTRMVQRDMTKEQAGAHDEINALWNRLAGARSTLFAAKNTEDFQSVGMKCRESLLMLAKTFSDARMVPSGQEAPQIGNFIAWTELIANYVAPGPSMREVRSYLKAIAKESWQLVNWLTHAQRANRFHGHLATEATEAVQEAFVNAASWRRSLAGK